MLIKNEVIFKFHGIVLAQRNKSIQNCPAFGLVIRFAKADHANKSEIDKITIC